MKFPALKKKKKKRQEGEAQVGQERAAGGSLKGHWAHGKLLVILENEAGSARIGARQLGEFGQVAAHLLDEFQLQVWKVVLQEATEVETHTGRAHGVPSLPRLSWRAGCHPTCLGWLVNFLEKGLVTLLVLYH